MQQILEVKTPKGVSGIKGATQAIKGATMPTLTDHYMKKSAGLERMLKFVKATPGAVANSVKTKGLGAGWDALKRGTGGAWRSLTPGQQVGTAATGAGLAGLMAGRMSKGE